MRDGGKRDAEIRPRFSENFNGETIAGVRRFGYPLRCQRSIRNQIGISAGCYLFLCPFNDIFRARVSLQTALIATAAIASVWFHDSVPEFARGISATVVNLSINDNTAADPGAKRQRDEALVTHTGPVAELPQCHHIHVVVHEDRQILTS